MPPRWNVKKLDEGYGVFEGKDTIPLRVVDTEDEADDICELANSLERDLKEIRKTRKGPGKIWST